MSAKAAGVVPRLMRAAILNNENQELAIETIPVPRPGRGEALVKVTACGVCHSDLHVIRGEVPFPMPAVLGHEISGSIVGLGGGQTSLSLGDEVVAGFIMPCTVCNACKNGRDDLCDSFFKQNRMKGNLYDGNSRLKRSDGSRLSMYSMGGLAEYSVVPFSALSPIPSNIPRENAAILSCALMTSYGAVHRAGEVHKNNAVAVIAVGGVGMSIIQIAKAAGASPIFAIDVEADRLALASELGADVLINSLEQDPRTVVHQHTGGIGVDVAFEALGRPETLRQAVELIGDGGKVVAVGIAGRGVKADFEITPFVRRGQTITGSFGARTRVDLPAVVSLAANGSVNLNAMVTETYLLDSVNDAYGALSRGEIVGRAVITMG